MPDITQFYGIFNPKTNYQKISNNGLTSLEKSAFAIERCVFSYSLEILVF